MPVYQPAPIDGVEARLLPVERRLVWKARLLSPAPQPGGPLLRGREAPVSRPSGLDESYIR